MCVSACRCLRPRYEHKRAVVRLRCPVVSRCDESRCVMLHSRIVTSPHNVQPAWALCRVRTSHRVATPSRTTTSLPPRQFSLREWYVLSEKGTRATARAARLQQEDSGRGRTRSGEQGSGRSTGTDHVAQCPGAVQRRPARRQPRPRGGTIVFPLPSNPSRSGHRLPTCQHLARLAGSC